MRPPRTAFAAAPDGRIFFAEKRGRVRVMADGVLLKEPFIDLTGEVNAAADRGMTGIACSSRLARITPYHVAYVYEPEEAKERNETGARVSRLVRFTADANDLNKVEEGSGVVLWEQTALLPDRQPGRRRPAPLLLS